jgi:uncharacterized membrane protein
MQAYIGQPEEHLPEVSREGRPVGTLLGNGDVLYVHLTSGKIIEVAPVTSVQLTATTVLVLNGDEVVRSFPRDSVFFASDQVIEPPCFE